MSAISYLMAMAAIRYAIKLDGCAGESPRTAEATLDPLTGFALPAVFEAELAMVASMSERQALPFSLLGCEIDGFQEYVNQFGRPAGEKLMRSVASSIGECVRLSDTIGRWDDERFLVILTGTRAEEAERVADKMRRRVAQIEAMDNGPVSLKFAITEHHAGDDPLSGVERVERQLAENPIL